MGITMLRITVFFEEPFWVGLYERECDGRFEVCKITFGAEPKDYEVYDFFLKNWSKLKFSPFVEAATFVERKINPKRMQRLIKKQIENVGVGTKAQQALKLQQEQSKLERNSYSREKRNEEKQRRFIIKQEKRKEKHRGH